MPLYNLFPSKFKVFDSKNSKIVSGIITKYYNKKLQALCNC